MTVSDEVAECQLSPHCVAVDSHFQFLSLARPLQLCTQSRSHGATDDVPRPGWAYDEEVSRLLPPNLEAFAPTNTDQITAARQGFEVLG